MMFHAKALREKRDRADFLKGNYVWAGFMKSHMRESGI